MNLKKSGKTLGKAVAASGGVVTGSYGMSMIPESIPGIAKGAIGIALGLGVALASSNPYVQSAAIGISASGTLVVIKEATQGQTGILAQVNEAIPTLGNADEAYYLPEAEEDFSPSRELLSGFDQSPLSADLLRN